MYNKVQRYREKKHQTENEMRSYLDFYKVRSEELKKEADDLQSFLCAGEEGARTSERVTNTRYSTTALESFILAGKRALKLKGVNFCRTQLLQGLHFFKMALADDPGLYEELREFEEENDEEEEYDEESIEEDDVEDDGNNLEMVTSNEQELMTHLMEDIVPDKDGLI